MLFFKKYANTLTLTGQSSLFILFFLYACGLLNRNEKWKCYVKCTFFSSMFKGNWAKPRIFFLVFFLRRMFSRRKSSMENVWPAVLLSLDLETHAIHGNPHLTWSFKEVTGFCARTSFNMSKCFSICFCLLSIHSSQRKNTGKFPLLPLQCMITVQGSAKSTPVDFFAVPWTRRLSWLRLLSSGNFNLEINFQLSGNNRGDPDISRYGLVIKAQPLELLLT